MSEVKVMEFQINFTGLNKKAYNESQAFYECRKAICWSNIMCEHYASVRKWLKPTAKGTKANCVPFENTDEVKEEMKKIQEHMDKWLKILKENKYGQ